MELQMTSINNDEARREGESGRAPFRSGRFFSASGKWFFATREGKDHGPFDSKEEAEAGLQVFLRSMGVYEAGRSRHDPWGRAR